MYSATEYGLCTMKPTVRHVQPPMGQIKVNLYKDVAAGRLQCISVIRGLDVTIFDRFHCTIICGLFGLNIKGNVYQLNISYHNDILGNMIITHGCPGHHE